MLGVDPSIALSVAKVESNLNPNVIGKHGEIGTMQLLPSSFPEFNKSELSNTRTNIILGVMTLKEAKARCPHKDGITYVICYNTGISGAKNIINPKNNRYYRKVLRMFNNYK